MYPWGFYIKGYIEERTVEISHYIIENKVSVRITVEKLGYFSFLLMTII